MNARWPAMMKRETAAEYCDLTPEQFDRQCMVAPIDQGWRGLRWKRSDLDRWIENLPTKPRKTLDDLKIETPNEEGCATTPPAANDTAEERRRRALESFG